MRCLKLLLITALLLLIIQCKEKVTQLPARSKANRVAIEIQHYSKADGFSVYYLVSDTFIQVDVNCKLKNCKRKTVYKRALRQTEGDSVYSTLQKLRLDTLKENYGLARLPFKGLEASIIIGGAGLLHKKTHCRVLRLPATDSLYKLIDKLILVKKYRYYDFE